jgi:GT2 family glycosyltransferase
VGAASRQEVSDRLPIKHEFLSSVSGGNCGMWRDVAMDLGWDERFTFGGSDIEFAWRAQLAGYRVDYAPRAVVSVREQNRLLDLARHWYRYGESGAKLFRTFRRQGMRRSRVVEAARVWAWLLVHVAHLWASPEARRSWVQLASYRAGRLAGSVRDQTLFL